MPVRACVCACVCVCVCVCVTELITIMVTSAESMHTYETDVEHYLTLRRLQDTI